MFNDSLIRIGMLFIRYMFVVVAAYFLLSAPIEVIFDSFTGGDYGEATSEMGTYVPHFKSVLTIFFALFLALPVNWFIGVVFHREPSSYYYRR